MDCESTQTWALRFLSRYLSRNDDGRISYLAAIPVSGGRMNKLRKQSMAKLALMTLSAVVLVLGQAAFNSSPTMSATAQREVNFIDHQFSPRSLNVLDGDTIQICNHDVIYHSPFSANRSNRFSGPQLPRGKCMSLTMHNPTTQPVQVGLYCEIHSEERLTLTISPRKSEPAEASPPPQTTYALTRIKVTRTYRPWDPNVNPGTTVEFGEQTYGEGQRSFQMGWEIKFALERTPPGRSHASAKIDLNQVPASITAGSSATFAASMTGEWQTLGYGIQRDHTISLSGAAGQKSWSRVGDPNGTVKSESITTSNTVTVPKGGGSEIQFEINARLNFGDDNWGTITIQLVYFRPNALNDEQVKPTARIRSIKDDVGVRHEEDEWQDAQVGLLLVTSDDVHTGPDSAATIEGYQDGWSLDMDQLAQVRIATLEHENSRIKVRVFLQFGTVRWQVFQNRPKVIPTDFSIQTPTATASVRGTIFTVRYDAANQITSVAVERGTVLVTPNNPRLGPFTLGASQEVTVSPNSISQIISTLKPPVGPAKNNTNNGDCLGRDEGARSSDKNAHYAWAQKHDSPELDENLKYKLGLLFECSSLGADELSSAFADISVLVAKYVPNSNCFNGDTGVSSNDWLAHQRWGQARGRQTMLDNVKWKVSSAMKCLGRSDQVSFFADVSVAIAKANAR